MIRVTRVPRTGGRIHPIVFSRIARRNNAFLRSFHIVGANWTLKTYLAIAIAFASFLLLLVLLG